MTSLVDTAAVLLVCAGVIAGAATLAATRLLKLGVGVLMDILLAAGLLRLAVPPTPERLATASALIAIRKVISLRWAQAPSRVPRRALVPGTKAGDSSQRQLKRSSE